MQVLSGIDSLKSDGFRVTKLRKAILNVIYNSTSPVTASQILSRLRKVDLTPNKSTVYRDLAFFVKNNLISEVILTSKLVHYESAFLRHHHHLVCTDCGSIKDVDCSEVEKPLIELKKRIFRSGFDIKNHSLEFYGICSSC